MGIVPDLIVVLHGRKPLRVRGVREPGAQQLPGFHGSNFFTSSMTLRTNKLRGLIFFPTFKWDR